MIVQAMDEFRAASRKEPGGLPSGSPPQGSRFGAAEARYHAVLSNIAERFGYQDIFLVDVATGDIVYSVARRKDFGTSLISGPYRTSNIATAFAMVRASGEQSFVRFVDFAPYEPSAFKPAAFIAAAIHDGPAMRGVLIARLSIDEINNVMTSNSHWQEEGLGRTGETYIVGDDFRMRNDSRFYIQDSALYIGRLRRGGADSTLVKKIQFRSTSIH